MPSISPFRDFFRRESASGALLLIAAAAGLIVANTPFSESYFALLGKDFSIGSGSLYLHLTTLKIINYLFMTAFFLVVGLEIKRELTSGHLSHMRSAMAPLIGALGGMALPALIYIAIAGNTASRGWGVAVATDIALAVGLLAALGSAVAPALRTFLLGLAVIDDIGAILIIAFIYSTGVKVSWLAAAVLATLVIALLKRARIVRTSIYVLIGALLWYCLYRCGVHPTLAGVILGLMAPSWPKESTTLVDIEDDSVTIIDWLIEKIHPWSSYLIVPLFAFANAGVHISGDALSEAMGSPIAWGVFAGLVLGKPLGIIASIAIAAKLKVAHYPSGAQPRQVLATGSAAGIGFTVAIFIAELAFPIDSQRDIAVIAIITASVVSALFSWALFKVKQNR